MSHGWQSETNPDEREVGYRDKWILSWRYQAITLKTPARRQWVLWRFHSSYRELPELNVVKGFGRNNRTPGSPEGG